MATRTKSQAFRIHWAFKESVASADVRTLEFVHTVHCPEDNAEMRLADLLFAIEKAVNEHGTLRAWIFVERVRQSQPRKKKTEEKGEPNLDRAEVAIDKFFGTGEGER